MGLQFGNISSITSCLGIKDRSLEWIERESEADERYKALHKAVLSGFDQFKSKYTTRTKRNKCRTISNRNQYIEEFRPQWQNLSVEGSLVIWNSKIFIPEGCRAAILRIFHSGHQGVTRALQNARQSVYWHGITRDVELLFARCKECQKMK